MYHVVEDDGHGVFHRAFWSFGQCITAFKHCRLVLSIDGTFLTGRYKGTIMVATAHSSNDNVLPVAFGLVPFEHQDNWEWFMRHVRENVIGDREVCIIRTALGHTESHGHCYSWTSKAPPSMVHEAFCGKLLPGM